jgi:hypothetical protein
MNECKKIIPKSYSVGNKYALRNSPPYSANKCKTMKKRGNDNKYYVSKPDKNGIYKWVAVTQTNKQSNNKTKTKNVNKITRKDLQILVKKYEVTKSGTNKEIAERLMNLRSHIIQNKTDLKIIQHFIK